MQITLNAQDLNDGLNTVSRALSSRPAKQILEGILVEAIDDEVILTCSDGSLSIECTITAEVAENGRTVLPGKLFCDMVRKLPGGSVTIKVGSNYAATVTCGKSRFNLSGMNPVEYPEMPEHHRGGRLEIPQKALKEMITRVVFAIAVDETRQILTGCLMEVTAEEARLVALDGYRMALQKLPMHFDLPEGTECMKAIIPGRVLNELSRILPDEDTPCTLSFENGRMQACFGNTVLSTVLLAGDYIDYRKILPASFRTMAKINRSAVQNAIDRASLMAREGKNNLIRMAFTPDTLTITSNAEMGDVREEMDTELDGDPIEIAFNAKYITDVIRNISEDTLNMHFNSSVSPCVFTPTEGDAYVYLILPVRIFQ